MSSDSEDEEAGQTWISIRSLKHAASIKTAYHSHCEGEASSHSSLNTSVTAESAPNLAINVSPSFSSLHESYVGLQIPPLKVPPLPSHSRNSSSTSNQMLTRRAQEEVFELQAELLTTKQHLQQVQSQLAVQEQQHAIQLQMIQAHHERKMLRHRQDFEEFLGRRPETAVERIKVEHEAAIRQIGGEFQERIERLEDEYEGRLREKEEKWAGALEKLREKLQEEAESKESRLVQSHKVELETLEKRHKLTIQQLAKPQKRLEMTHFSDLQITSDFSPSHKRNAGKCEGITEIQKADLEGLKPPVDSEKSSKELKLILSRIE